MAGRSSPTVKRRRLAAELRHLREAAGLTIDDVAERLEWSTAKISRIENARVSVLPRDVKFLLRVYGMSETDDAWDVLTLAGPGVTAEGLVAAVRRSRARLVRGVRRPGSRSRDHLGLRRRVRAGNAPDRGLRPRRPPCPAHHRHRRRDRPAGQGPPGPAGATDIRRCAAALAGAERSRHPPRGWRPPSCARSWSA